MAERDPRVNPKVGDVLVKGGKEFVVTYSGHGIVRFDKSKFRAPIDHFTIEHWRIVMELAEVVDAPNK